MTPPDSARVEAVAKAIFDADDTYIASDWKLPGVRGWYETMARAAFAALKVGDTTREEGAGEHRRDATAGEPEGWGDCAVCGEPWPCSNERTAIAAASPLVERLKDALAALVEEIDMARMLGLERPKYGAENKARALLAESIQEGPQ